MLKGKISMALFLKSIFPFWEVRDFFDISQGLQSFLMSAQSSSDASGLL